MKTIYHIHNEICGHATNTLKEVVNYALNHNYTRLVFTEHSPLDDNQMIFRPSHAQVAHLREQIDKVNSKYKGKLKIEFGYEIEYPKVHREYFHNFINDLQCDFLIFGNHFYGDM
jgi:histidinol-phosphatase (PHP family)